MKVNVVFGPGVEVAFAGDVIEVFVGMEVFCINAAVLAGIEVFAGLLDGVLMEVFELFVGAPLGIEVFCLDAAGIEVFVAFLGALGEVFKATAGIEVSVGIEPFMLNCRGQPQREGPHAGA